ncbi:hypothetical protein Tco_0020773, partial [Tanacetum coccineum]
MALEEKIRVLTANLENTTNTLSYTKTLHDQAQKEKKEWEVKYEATLARFEKWKESPNDAPTPTADAAGRAEDPTLLTGLSAKLDRCTGCIDSLESELGKSKKIMGGAILTLVSRIKKLEKTVKQLRETRLVVDASAAEGDVDIQDDIDLDGLSRMASTTLGHDQPAVPSEDVEEREEKEVPLRRKRSVYRRARTEFFLTQQSLNLLVLLLLLIRERLLCLIWIYL